MDGLASRSGSHVPALAMDWIMRDAQPRLFVTDRLMILWTNRAADRELSARRELEVRDGGLAATNPVHADDLESLVRDAGEGPATLALPCEDRDGHVLLRAQRVGRALNQSSIGVQFYRSSVQTPQYADFGKVFGLTRAEHRVLLLLLDGRTADEISVEKQVSIETVRYQIRQIYVKLDVSSREAMFRRITPYML